MPALPLTDKMLESVAQRFRLLGEPMRLRILQVLEGGERTVGEIVAALDGNQPNISSHLRALWDGGLLKRRRSGTSVYYSIADPTIFRLCDLVCRSAAREARAQLAELVPQRHRIGNTNR